MTATTRSPLAGSNHFPASGPAKMIGTVAGISASPATNGEKPIIISRK